MPKKEEEFDIKEIYTPLSVAKKEIWRRWNDPVLRKKVEDFLGGDVPEILKKEPKAVLARHVSTPNFECLHFIELASLLKLKPINLEYLQDKYLSCNSAKFHLGKVCFFKGNNKEGTIEYEHIMDFANSENKAIDKIKTLYDMDLVDFHHNILKLNKIKISSFDISKWYQRNGGKAKRYMKYYLALFICNGVLFENYLTYKNEGQFTSDIVLPALKEVENIFGVKPLIVPIMPPTEKDEIYWLTYPNSVKKYLKYLKNKK